MFSPRFDRLGLCRHEHALAQACAPDATLAFQHSGASGGPGAGDAPARTALCAAVMPDRVEGSVPPHPERAVVDVVVVTGVVVVAGDGRSSRMSARQPSTVLPTAVMSPVVAQSPRSSAFANADD